MNKIQLMITLDQQTGQIDIAGPIENKVLCLGLLSFAERLVQDYQAPQKLIQPAVGIPRMSKN